MKARLWPVIGICLALLAVASTSVVPAQDVPGQETFAANRSPQPVIRTPDARDAGPGPNRGGENGGGDSSCKRECRVVCGATYSRCHATTTAAELQCVNTQFRCLQYCGC